MAAAASLADCACACSSSSFFTGDEKFQSPSSSSSWSGRRRRVVATRAQSAAIDSHFVLGLDHTASKQEIKRAYRNLALQYHPDVCKGTGNEHVFTQINLAYECLMNESQSHHQILEQQSSRTDQNFGSAKDEWLSEGYTFEEIFGTMPCYHSVDESLFREGQQDRPGRKVNKSRRSREDW